MNAHPVLLQMKYAHVIECFSAQTGITLREAMDFFYHSATYQLMCKGISEMHCRSDGDLADELQMEYNARQQRCQAAEK